MFDPWTNPLLYLVRHGTTEANENGLFRGFADYPLNDDGIAAAEEAAHFLSFRMIGHVACSPMQRAVQTAQIVAPAVSLDFDRNPGLYPWNIGDFSGKSKAKYAEQLQRYIENPDLAIPNGESLGDFRRRTADTLYRYMAQASYQQPVVLITHTSNITAAHQTFDPDWDISAPETADLVEPGGIVAVYADTSGKTVMQPVLGAVITESTPTVT